jgi:short-chain fatty acids transporter
LEHRTVHRLGELFSRINRRVQPDAMVLACLLTIFVAALAIAWPHASDLSDRSLTMRGLAVVQIWFDGIWNPGFLTFALQMCVVLLTGYGLAKAPIATRFLGFLASCVQSNRGGVALVAFVACLGCWINWGFGLIAAGVLAARVRDGLHRQGKACRYALIVAGAYSGMMIWHGGLSGSAPLKVAKDGVHLADTAAGPSRQLDPIPVTGTVLSPANLGLTVVLILGLPLLLALMAAGGSAEDDEVGAREGTLAPARDGCEKELSHRRGEECAKGFSHQREHQRERTPADRVNESRILPAIIGLGLLVALADKLVGISDGRWSLSPGAINLNFVNALFLAMGLLLHRNLIEYVRAVGDGGRAVTGIVLQFPLYAGIQGIMFGAGLAAAMSEGFVSAAEWTASATGLDATHTFPVATFLSAGLVNFFVPSGGGQWIVQGPIMCAAAESLGASIPQTIMAVSYGDQWTNMIQPFWAIPLMGLTGVNVRRFMGYCALLMLLAGPVFVAALLLM